MLELDIRHYAAFSDDADTLYAASPAISPFLSHTLSLSLLHFRCHCYAFAYMLRH